MKVLIPSPLQSYTGGRSRLEAKGQTLAEVMDDLERRHPGIRFRVIDEQERVRPHMRIFIAGREAADLSESVAPVDEVMIVAALSGG